MLRRRVGKLLLSIAALATMSACADDVVAIDTRDITVRPRVVVDGTVELSDRTAGRVLLSGISAHADEARVALADGSVVVDDTAPLFFAFSPTRPEDQQAAERTWSLPLLGGDLRVGFSPADADAIANAPFDATALTNHTVVITGSIAITPDDDVSMRGHDDDGLIMDGSVADVDPDGTPADVDPDGTPADGVGEVDPDGSPADEAEVDPDGSPADVDPDGSPADVDPDGSPADVDPDGSPADVDPDGTPAIGAGSRFRDAAGKQTKGAKARRTMQGNLVGRPEIRVPFTLTVDGAFEHHTTLGEDAIAAVDAGEVLPIDLRFQAGAFFDAERLAVLESLAAEAVRTGDEDGLALQVSAATTARMVKVEARRAVSRVPVAQQTSSKIVVTGPMKK